MRNQFYSDRKDIWKWSLLLELAGQTHHIYQVAMLTHDNGEHKLDMGDPGTCSELVYRFFDRERRRNARDIYGVEQLVNGRVTVLSQLGREYQFYSKRCHQKYFAHVIQEITAENKGKKVVFLDPDVGLEVTKSNDGHVLYSDVCRVWTSLSDGDYLVVYQHHPLSFKWKKDEALLEDFARAKKEQIGRALGVEPTRVNTRSHDSVSFFWLLRCAADAGPLAPPNPEFRLPPLPELRSATVFGRKIRYYDIGSGAPLVLVHGVGGDADQWAFCFDELSRTHRVIALELLGFGRSDKPNISYRIAGFVEVLEGFLRALGVDRASLLGHSLGGWIVAAFALQFPERVDRLVLNDAAGIDAGAIRPPVDLNISTHAHMRAMLESMFYNKAMVTDALVDLAYSLHLERNDGPTIRSALETLAMPDEKLDRNIGALKLPTLLLWGEQDGLTPLSVARNFERLIPGARLEVIPQCGHLPCLEKPAEFTRRVLDFLG